MMCPYADGEFTETRRTPPQPTFPVRGTSENCVVADRRHLPSGTTARPQPRRVLCRNVETTDPLEYGTRAELVIQANSSAFRALSQVKAIRTSAAGMEFLQLTASGREILRELLAQLAMIKAAHEDRSRREEAELMLPEEHSPVLILAERLPTLGGASAAKPADGSVVVTERQRSLLELPCEDISVDVFV